MAGSIKGIVVEIGGDTSGLQKALSNVNKATSSLSKELRGINSLLKLDPKNTELLAQKQKVLGDEIANTSKKLELLKDRQKEIANSPELAEHRKQYRALQREIILTENQLKELKIEASGWTQASQNLEGIGNTLTKLGDGITEIGKKASVASASVGALFAMGIKYNADIETATKSYEAFLGSAEEAEKAVEAIREQSKTSPFSTQDLVKANQMLITTGISADEARETISALADAIALTGGGNDELTRMASNLQQIQNAGKATSMDIRQFAYAGIDVYGILAETTGKNVEEIKKMDVTYEELSKALQTASQEGGKYYKGQEQGASTLNGQINQLKKSFQDLLAELTKSLLPTFKKIVGRLQNVVKWFSNLSDGQKEMITRVGLLVTALGPVLIILGKIITSGGAVFKLLSSLTGAIAKVSAGAGGLSSVISVLTGPIGIVIASVTALVGIFTALYKTNEDFRNKVNETINSVITLIQEDIMPILEQLKEFIGQVIGTILDIVKNLWDTLSPLFATIFETLMKFWNGFAKDIVSAIANVLSWLLEKANWLYANVIQPIVGFLTGVLMGTITSVIGSITNVISGITNIVTSVWEGIKTTLNGIIEFVTGVFTGDWQLAWEGVKDVFSGIWDSLIGVVKGVVNLIIGALNTFINGINKISFDVPDWVPGIGGKKWGFNIPNIPELATGGIVTQDTLARIGEGIHPEAIIPLDKNLTRYLSEAMKQAGMGNMVVNFYPQQMTDAELERAFNYIDRRFGMAY